MGGGALRGRSELFTFGPSLCFSPSLNTPPRSVHPGPDRRDRTAKKGTSFTAHRGDRYYCMVIQGASLSEQFCEGKGRFAVGT